jgi:N-acetylglucosaminyldiphosphoundecaprenol N-acetyl-beta-D-mannosaminyltransferase
LRILDWCREPARSCRYVVTPNVDHAVLLRQHAAFREAYRDADLVLADGHPIVWASRLLGNPVPERVPGSDLVPRLFAAADPAEPLRVFLLGAAEGIADRAARNVSGSWPGVHITGTWSPPPGFENSPQECEIIFQRISDARPQLVVVGFGAPKQELWVHRHRDRIEAAVALCVGATIDFLAGHKRRAPVWMQRAGIEWVHRMCTDPRRMVRRYARDAWIFPQMVLAQWVANRTGRQQTP